MHSQQGLEAACGVSPERNKSAGGALSWKCWILRAQVGPEAD